MAAERSVGLLPLGGGRIPMGPPLPWVPQACPPYTPSPSALRATTHLKCVSIEFSSSVGLHKETILPDHIRPLGGSWSRWKNNEFINVAHSVGFLSCKILHLLLVFVSFLSLPKYFRTSTWKWWQPKYSVDHIYFEWKHVKKINLILHWITCTETQVHNFAAITIGQTVIVKGHTNWTFIYDLTFIIYLFHWHLLLCHSVQLPWWVSTQIYTGYRLVWYISTN